MLEDVVLSEENILYEMNADRLDALRRSIVGACNECDNGNVVTFDMKKRMPKVARCKCVKRYDRLATLVKAGIPTSKLDKVKDSRRGIFEKKCVPYRFRKEIVDGEAVYKSSPGKVMFLYKDRINSYISNERYKDGKSLFLFGPNGCGKTITMLDLMDKFSEIPDFSLYYASMRDLVDIFMSSSKRYINEQSAFYKKLFKVILNCDFLAIDEFGKETKVEKMAFEVQTAIETIIKYRVDNGLATIISTNYSPDDLCDEYNDSIVSVLQERYEFILLDTTIDYRFNI